MSTINFDLIPIDRVRRYLKLGVTSAPQPGGAGEEIDTSRQKPVCLICGEMIGDKPCKPFRQLALPE
jgi:hypothetical protein